MDKSTPALIGAAFTLAVAIWIFFEFFIARPLAKRGHKDRGWAQGLLVWGPLAAGPLLALTDVIDVLMPLIPLVGYTPKRPPGLTGDLLTGTLASVIATACHHKIGKWLRGRYPVLFEEQRPGGTD